MRYRELIMRSRELVFALLMLLALGPQAHAQEVPSVPATSTGNYNVVFTWPIESQWTWLQERVGANGAWTYADTSTMTPAGGLSVNAPFNNKPPGTYYYRIEVFYQNEYGETWTSWSEAASVVVSGGGGPGPSPVSQDLVSNQLNYTYGTRVGDINGDGRTDLFVQRTAGGQSGNGTVADVILRRLADGTFTPEVPTASQASAASSWPASSQLVELLDINLDGYIDIRLPDLGNVISGALGQIIFSSGQPGTLAPRKVTQIGAKLNKFNDDMNRWIDDPQFFVNNSPILWYPVYGLVYVCDYWEYWNCWWEYQLVGYQGVYDFRQWDPDAVNMRYSFNQTASNGDVQPGIVAGSQDAIRIGNLFQNVYGVPLMRGVLGNNCYDYEYDPVTGLPCIEFELTITIVGVPREKGCRGLTVGEKLAAIEEQLYVEDIDKVRVCNRHYWGRWVPQILRFMRGANIAPDGHIYIAPTGWQGGWLTWREDYTLLPMHEFEYGGFLHELMHVFQVRNGNCGKGCISGKAIRAMNTGGYVYMPLVPGRAFRDYNIEQQAEMVQDRFLLRHGLDPSGTPTGHENADATWYELNNLIGVLQGFFIF